MRHDAPLCGQPTFAQRIASMEAEMPGDLSYGADQTIADMLTCIREQQAALSRLLNDVEPHSTCAWAEGESVTEARATLARWRIEP